MEHREILQLRVRAWMVRERSKSLQLFKSEVGNLLRVKSNKKSYLNMYRPYLSSFIVAFKKRTNIANCSTKIFLIIIT